MKGDYRVCLGCLGHIRRARLPPMSSLSTSTSSTSSARPTPKPIPNSDGGSAFGGSGVTNYFFGFLFLFAVILLILIGCGIGTRRRLLSRRPNPLASLEPWAVSGLRGEITPPKFHETRFVVAPAAGWKDVMPLSAVYLTNEKDLNEKSSTDGGLGQTAPNQPARTFLPTLRKTPPDPKAALRVANAIRVAILVAMPSPRDEHQGPTTDDHINPATAFGSETNLLKKAPEEIQIGVKTLPWRES